MKTWIIYSLGCKFYSWVEISDPRPFSEFIWVWIILELGTISPFNQHWIFSQSMIKMAQTCVNSNIGMLPIKIWFLMQFRNSTLISANFDLSAFLWLVKLNIVLSLAYRSVEGQHFQLSSSLTDFYTLLIFDMV